MLKKLLSVLMIAAMMLAMAAGCADTGTGDTDGDETTAGETTAAGDTGETASELKPIAKEDVVVGFVYIGDINDGGYTQAHDKGRLALEELGYKCYYKENVPETSDCETAIQELIDLGCNVIYTTSFGHMDFTANMAKKYPSIYFGHATGYTTLANMCNYMGRVIEARYLTGIVAGLATKNGKIGYVAAHPYAECIRGINAFTLGVRSVNPTATVEVLFTQTWYDVAVEKQAALELLNKGVDVMAQHQDSTACQLAAEEKGVLAIGYNTPTPDAAPNAYMTAALFNWAKFYTDNVQSIVDGTWTNSSYWKGLADGWVDIDTLTALCPEGAQAKVDEAKQAIISGDLVLFSGDVKDQNGEVKATNMTDEEIYNMNWFVEGVIGTIE